MKTRFLLAFAAALACGGAGLFAGEAKPAPPAQATLALVVVEHLNRQEGAITDFDRLDLAFQKVAKKRNWPVKVLAEQFASNTPDHETELRVFLQPLREETRGDLSFRSWATLTAGGVKHDFGIVTFRYYLRAGENPEDSLEKVFLGAANALADKVEPVLFPAAKEKR